MASNSTDSPDPEPRRQGWLARFGPYGACLLLAAIAVGVLTPGFYANAYRAVPRQLFLLHQTDGESLVIGRLLESRAHGPFTYGGLLGNANPEQAGSDGDRLVFSQYIALIEGTITQTYRPYLSHPDGQGLLFFALYRLTGYDGALTLRLGKGLNSVLFAAVMAALIGWLYRQAGAGAALALLGSLVLLRWPTLFARNLFWCMWAFYLPAIAVLLCTRSVADGQLRSLARLGLAAAAGIYVKYLFTGFEYITTVLVMTVTPLVYVWLKQREPAGLLIRRAVAVGIGSGAAIVLGLAQLALQVAACEGSLRAAISHLALSFVKRSHASPEAVPEAYRASLETPLLEVLGRFWRMGAADLSVWLPPGTQVPGWFWVTFAHLITALLAVTVLGLLLRHRSPHLRQRRDALAGLAGATWFSILAPLSWLIVFKAHSADHYHMNAITWHMPFLLLGIGLAGLVAEALVRDLIGFLAARRR